MQPGGFPHQISDFIMASLHAGFSIEDIKEFAPDAELAVRYPRAEKYVGGPCSSCCNCAPRHRRQAAPARAVGHSPTSNIPPAYID